MKNKKISRILGPILGVMGFISAIGMAEIPVFAEENVQANSAYTSSSATSTNVAYNDYSMNISKSETQNGVKVTVDKAIITKHKLKVVLKIESEKTLDKMKFNESIFEVTYGNETEYSHTNSNEEYINDKTAIITLEEDNYQGEYPEKGEMRVDVVLSNYKVNIGIDMPVDFTKSFNNIIKKDISTKIPELNYTINAIESDVMGTRISYSQPQENEDADGRYNPTLRPTILLKVGDKMYKTDSHGTYSSEENIKRGNYELNLVTYDKIKDEKNISIIPLSTNIRFDELRKLNEQSSKGKGSNDKATTNNVSYEKTIVFTDGTKGQIYNIERNENSIKVYCKGESEKESLLMASNMDIYYKNIEGQEGDGSYYDNSNNVTFYKDQKEALGYIVEFNNVNKDKMVELDYDLVISNIDRYKLGDEIKISN